MTNITKKSFEGGYVATLTASFDEAIHTRKGFNWTVEMPCKKWMAIEQHSPFWCRPAWGKTYAEMPNTVEELVFDNGDGTYTAYLCLTDDTAKTSITTGTDALTFRTEVMKNDTKEVKCLAFVCMDGTSPLTLMKAIAKKGAEILGIKMRSEKKVPDFVNKFGWCSWDAMQIRVSEEGLLQKVKEFKDKNVPVQYGIIDDMWGDCPHLKGVPAEKQNKGPMFAAMHQSRMRNFEGDPDRFPKGLKHCVDEMKKNGMPEVALWFPTTGYWAGYEVGSPIYNELVEKDCIYLAPNGTFILKPEKSDVYFDTLCQKAKEFGMSFVKIDNQGCNEKFRGDYYVGQSSKYIQQGIDKAVFKYFDGQIINCMGMPAECMFHRPESAVSRCSDDFQPESRSWFSKNILECAYNGLLQGQYYINDWDMFWTDDEQAEKNALAHAISGGPVYVSDKIDRTRPEILKPLVHPDGSLTVCDISATPTDDCIMNDPTTNGKPLKIVNHKGNKTYVVAYNIDKENKNVSGFLSLKDGDLPKDEYEIREFFTGKTWSIQGEEKVEINLKDNDEYRLYTIVKKGDDFGDPNYYLG